ncbi:hypothetical protein CSAL01_01790 [Colletotrichum salicis]|uniref:Uncharacterized protein n=1 Tax=Colletotrichum salicis TaxID=1209931 RepID=A0A135T6V3_9PEZI|nr:hypothetical protein CSAL01_01790 [Colletotrichum salicis]
MEKGWFKLRQTDYPPPEIESMDGRAVEYGGVLGGGAPVLAAAGALVTAKADVKAIFKDSVSNCEKYERLDTYLIQVSKAYIADCLERDTVAKELPAIASVRAEPSVARSKDMTTAAEKQSDFVWAIRLAKVHKGILMKN